MKYKNINTITDKYPNKRDIYDKIQHFIDLKNTDPDYDDKVIIIYGLPRTGKTTLLEQTLANLKESNKCAFYEIQADDSIYEVEEILDKELENNTKYIVLDEITRMKDFVDNSSSLANLYSKEGMVIILSGTDSLSFELAQSESLLGKSLFAQTTHIPFAEHSRIFNTNNIDNYIEHGGLMFQHNEALSIKNKRDTDMYIKSVASNISNSLSKAPNTNILERITKDDLTKIINKIVEKYSGTIDADLIQKNLKKSSVTYIHDKIKDITNDQNYIRHMNKNSTKTDIAKEFLPIVNSYIQVTDTISDKMVDDLIEKLETMDVLSTTESHVFEQHDETNEWSGPKKERDCYIVQPAIKYYHLKEGMNFIKTSEWYSQINDLGKEYLSKKLQEYIYGDMLEQIILFDTNHDLIQQKYLNEENINTPKFTTCKPSFKYNKSENRKQAEYDMLITDNTTHQCYAFEIKHTTTPVHEQAKHLLNPEIDKIIKNNYGDCIYKTVLYNGESFNSQDNIKYLNAKDFLKTIHETKDIHETMKILTENLPDKRVLTAQEQSMLDDLPDIPQPQEDSVPDFT